MATNELPEVPEGAYASDEVPLEPPTPTQVQHPWRAMGRTLFAALVALAAMFPLLVDASGLEETSGPIAGALAITGAITRIMAIPQVDDFLQKFLPFLATK